MSEHMLAARLYGPRDLRIEEVPKPRVDPDRGWVLVETLAAGICGTDKAFYTGSYPLFKTPLIPGHEVVGVVVEGPEQLRGRLVTSEINLIVDPSHPCVREAYTHCPPEARRVLGIDFDGGMAEYFATRRDAVHAVEGIEPPERGIFVEPLAAVLRAFRLEPLKPRTRLAVIGTGLVALLAAQVARLHGADVTVYARRGSPKARMFEKLGFHLEYVEELDVERVKWSGAGYDAVLEATGSPEGLGTAVALVKPLGTVYAKSTHGRPASIDATVAVVKEVRIVGSRCGWSRDFEDAIRLIREGLVETPVTAVYPLREARAAFERSLERDAFRVIIKP